MHSICPPTRNTHQFVVRSLSRVRLFVIPWTAAHQASLSFTISQSLLKLMSIELVMPITHVVNIPFFFPSWEDRNLKEFSFLERIEYLKIKYKALFMKGAEKKQSENQDSDGKRKDILFIWGARLFSSVQFSSVQFSRSVISDSLRPHESQQARLPCPSQTPRVYSDSCPLSRWCHPTISSSVVPFSSCPQSLPASGSFPMSQLFSWGGQSTGVSASASVLPMNTQDWSPLAWTGCISLQSKGLSRVFSNITVQKHQFFSAQLSSQSNSHIHTWPLEKP